MSNFAEAQRKRNEFYQNNAGPQAGMTEQVASYKQLETFVKKEAQTALQDELQSLSKNSDKEQLTTKIAQIDFKTKLSAYRNDQVDSIIEARSQNSQRTAQVQGGYKRQFITREKIDEMNAHEEKFNAFMREKGRVPVEGEMEKFTAKPTVSQSEKPWNQKPKTQSM
ncbi:hypothetical protein [Xanthomonas cannabis]|uniref:hypothetical protein n=1 Tax=Xanthomonas cannabis TaxID=1885674 RepID=UPI0011128A40|nr:hypothetical protein [Xanthomonas cannabis]